MRYGDPAQWSGAPFGQLHDLLIALVDGGPGSTPMAEREESVSGTSDGSDTDFEPPTMPQQRPLDLVLLGAINAALAEVIGLMFTDEDARPGETYDYMVVADHTGAGGLDAARVLSLIAAGDFAEIDAWACFGILAASGPPLAAPASVRAYALPGATHPDPDGALVEASSCVGLRWSSPTSAAGSALPREPVMHRPKKRTSSSSTAPVSHTVRELEELFPVTRSTIYRAIARAGARAPASPEAIEPAAVGSG